MENCVLELTANDDYTLNLLFTDGSFKILDVKPLLEKGSFKELKDINLFKQVKISDGAIEWSNNLDLSFDTLYILSHSE